MEFAAARVAPGAAVNDAVQRLNNSLAGKYSVDREIGRGGMATVYLAQDVKHEREVAIKVLLPELAASIGADRFEREIKVAAKLQHPNILGLYDSGVSEGQMFYVMPFVKGESLRDRIDREGQLSVDDAVRITTEVASALGFAHSLGIIHRDIKPENILMNGEHALVADFGIAKAVSEAGQQKLTQTGMAVGTPVYMAPEQSAGETVGPTADLYSLGCMLYEMLSGEPPFTGKSAMAIMARHVMEQVPSIRIVRNSVPEEIEEAIFAVLGKVPADRPQSAAAFIEMMGMPMGMTGTMRTRGGAGRRMTSTYQVPESVAPPAPAWRKPVAIAAGAAFAASVAFGAWKMTAGAPKASAGPESRRLAVLYFQDLSRDSSLGPLADGLTEELINSLSTTASLTTISRNGVEKYRGTSVAPDSIARALRAGYLVRGEVETDGGKVRVNVRLDDGSGVKLRSATFTGAAGNQLALRDTIAVVAGDMIRQELGQDLRLKEQRFRTTSKDAWLFAQRAEQAWKAADAASTAGDSLAADERFRSADSLFVLSSQADAVWPQPGARRAAMALRRARLASGTTDIATWVNAGIAIADSALVIDKDNPDALEARGTLRYWGWLQGIAVDAAQKDAALVAARSDLERAVLLNPAQAGAYASLSHLYYQVSNTTKYDVLASAEKAYATDEFLSNANVILQRIFNANYDLQQFQKAAKWCDVARQRFPQDFRSMRCKLDLLTTNLQPPNIAQAWAFADSAVSLVGPAKQPIERLRSHMLVAAVIARASKQPSANASVADSARHVARRSIGDPTLDPPRELAFFGAFVYTLLGDNEEAIRLLKEYLAVSPERVVSMREDLNWWFKPLEADPKFKQALGI